MRLTCFTAFFALLFITPVMGQWDHGLRSDMLNQNALTLDNGDRNGSLVVREPFAKPDVAIVLKDSADEKEKNWKFLFAFDARSSFIRFDGATHNAKLFGLKLGATYKKRHRFGWGVYFLQSNKTPIVVEKGLVPRLDTITNEVVLDTLVHRVNFGYQSLFYEYVFYQKQRWEFSAPLHIGLGVAEVREGIRGQIGDTLIATVAAPLMGISVGGHYKIMPWMGLGAGFGYRLMLSGDRNIRRALNAPIFIFKMKLFLGDAYRGMFKRKHGYRLLYRKCDPCKADWDQ